MKVIVVIEYWDNCEYNNDLYANSNRVLSVVSNTDIARKLIDSRIEELTSEARKVEPTVEVKRLDYARDALHIRYNKAPLTIFNRDLYLDEEYAWDAVTYDLIDEL